jgi:DNA-damage-inducible protein J
MAQAMVNFRMDENLKKEMEQTCQDMGMSMTTAFTIFAIKVSKERRIPFEVAADPDPFYSEANMNRLRKAIADVQSGKATLKEHELIEVDDD